MIETTYDRLNRLKVHPIREGEPIELTLEIDDIESGPPIELQGASQAFRLDVYYSGLGLLNLEHARVPGQLCKQIDVRWEEGGDAGLLAYDSIWEFLNLLADYAPGSDNTQKISTEHLTDDYGDEYKFQVKLSTVESMRVFPALDRMEPPLAELPDQWDEPAVLRALSHCQVSRCELQNSYESYYSVNPYYMAHELVSQPARLAEIEWDSKNRRLVSIAGPEKTLRFEFNPEPQVQSPGLEWW